MINWGGYIDDCCLLLATTEAGRVAMLMVMRYDNSSSDKFYADTHKLLLLLFGRPNAEIWVGQVDVQFLFMEQT